MHKNSWLLLASTFALSLSLVSCIDVEDNRRVQVLGTLVDDSGSPVSGITVQSSGDNTELGAAISDENGDFRFTSLESTADDFSIDINREFSGDTLYPPITYINGARSVASTTDQKEGKRSQNFYDLGNVTLRQYAFLDLNIKKTSASQDTLRYTIKVPEAYCNIYLSKSKIDATRSRCFENYTRSGTIVPGGDDEKYGLRTLKNADAILEYTVNSGEPKRITIPITKYKSSYDFEF